MFRLQQRVLLRLRDHLTPIIRRTVEDVVLETIERKGIPSRTEFDRMRARVDAANRVIETWITATPAPSGAAPAAAPEQPPRKATS